MVGRWIRAFGWRAYYEPAAWGESSPHGSRGTRDGRVPFRVFFELARAIDSTDSATELRDVMATQLGLALHENGKDWQVQKWWRDLKRRAYPIDARSLTTDPDD